MGLFLALLWAAYQFRMRQVQHAFDRTLEARVGERTRIARELHDTLLQSFHGLLLRFQTVSYLLPERPAEAKEKLDGAIQQAATAVTEGRNAVQGLRASTVERNDLAVAIRTLGDELATDTSVHRPSTFHVAVEGHARDLHPIVRDEIYRIAAEALRNAFRHAHAGRVEVDIRYDDQQFRLRVRDDGQGIDAAVLANQGIEGHYGLRGMPERAALIGGKLAVWSEVGRRDGGGAAPSGQHRLRDSPEALLVVTPVAGKTTAFGRRRRFMSAMSRHRARIRTVWPTDGPAFRLMLIVLVVACGGQAAIAQTAVPGGQRTFPQDGDAPVRDLRFTHLTTNDGLSQGYVVDILQDRRGFMWFATRDGLNRYDGYTFVVYKHDPNDPDSLSSNFLQDLMEDDRGNLWVATSTGVNRFDPTTERCTRYLHDPDNPDTLAGASVKSVAQDSRGYIWFGTEDSGLDRLDPRLGTFTHYRNDSDGRFVGRITQVIEDRHGDIWFTGERGLFHVNQQTGEITRRPAAINGLSADSVYEDEAGDLWMLTNSPVVGLVRYDRRAERVTSYPLAARAPRAGGVLASTTSGGSLNGTLAADGQNGLWVPSSEGLSYFDRRTERFTHRFQHDAANPHSLDSNAIFSVYQDRGGVMWVGTENAGLNILNFRQQQFVHYKHRPADPNSRLARQGEGDPPGSRWRGVGGLVPSRPGPIGSEDGQDHPLPSRRGRRE